MLKPKIKLKLKFKNKDHDTNEYPPKKLIELKIKPLIENVQTLPTIIKIESEKSPSAGDNSDFFQKVSMYHIIKCPLKSVLKKYDQLHPIIEQIVRDMNQITILGYQFIKLFLIHHYELNKDQPLPNINKQWIMDILKIICHKTKQSGSKIKKERVKQLEELQNFYDHVFGKITHIERPSYTHKSHLIDHLAEEMMTCLTTNLKTNFIKYLSKYINCLFKKPKAKIIHQNKDLKQRKIEYQQLNKEIRDLKTDLIHATIEHSKTDYHAWIRDHLRFLCPSVITENLAFDVKCQPLKYLKHAIYINKQIELLHEKPYQVIPQRNTMIPCHITLDTTNMVDLINNSAQMFGVTKPKLYRHVQKYQPLIWSQILKLEKKLFRHENYSFHYQFKTDGWSCELLFINNQYKKKKYKTKIPKEKMCLTPTTNRFKILENLTDEECQMYQSDQYKRIGNDPGKRHIMTVIDEEIIANDHGKMINQGNVFQYSACQHRRANYTKRSSQIINQEKKRHGIDQLESCLTGVQTPVINKKKYKHRRRHRHKPLTSVQEPLVQSFNSQKRSLNPLQYETFIDQKNQINPQVKSFYEQDLMRKLSFRRYVCTQHAYHQLINRLIHTYLSDQEIKQGKKIVMFHGDYSRTTQMSGCVPSPNKGLTKLMSQYFDIIYVKEYNTSKLYWKTHEPLTNMRVRVGHHMCSIHGVLIPKEKPERCIHVDRDVNACHNILYLATHYLKMRERPQAFSR